MKPLIYNLLLVDPCNHMYRDYEDLLEIILKHSWKVRIHPQQ